MTSHIMDQLTDRRAIIRFLNALDELPPEILRMIAGRIVAKLCPGVLKVNEVNNFSSSVLRRLSFSRKLASAALHELPTVVTIEYNGPRLEFDLLQYTTPLARSIIWLPFPPRQLQHLSLLVPLGGSHAHYLRGMTESILTLPEVFPGLNSLSLVLRWSGQFIIPGNTAAERAQIFALLCEIFVIARNLAAVEVTRRSVHDLTWRNGPVSFDGSRKAAFARLLQEDLISGCPTMSRMMMPFLRTWTAATIAASNDEDMYIEIFPR